MRDLQISCHCGALSQTLTNVNPQDSASRIPLCHCYGCRHSTGQLFASYVKLQLTSLESIKATDNLAEYTAVSEAPDESEVKLYFCSTCGCHLFRSITSAAQTTIEVASGTLVNGKDAESGDGFTPFGPHMNVEETVDGGLSKWMTNIPTQSQAPSMRHYSASDVANAMATGSHGDPESSIHIASCLCKRVSFQVHAPTEASLAPHSDFADLIIPYSTHDPRIKNPGDVKWWMRRNNTRFMAGTCACKSCRLVSGFEIQAWAFVPRVNIMFRAGASENNQGLNRGDGSSEDEVWTVLDFDTLHQNGTLAGYESSAGVLREFCPSCGATVFWHDTCRPKLIDVSVGLLVPQLTSTGGYEGVRIESLLEWWTDRVSFAEDATLGRTGAPERRAKWLVEMLQEAMCRGSQ